MRHWCTALIASAPLALAAAPASAAPATPSAPVAACSIDAKTIVACATNWALDTVESLEPATPHGLAATATFAAVPLGPSFEVVSACAAAAGGAAVSVRITRCGVGSGATVGLPGPVAAIGGRESVGFGPTQVCWEASATFADGHVTTTSGCGGTISFTTEDIWGTASSRAER
jgi:hypothetical protein